MRVVGVNRVNGAKLRRQRVGHLVRVVHVLRKSLGADADVSVSVNESGSRRKPARVENLRAGRVDVGADRRYLSTANCYRRAVQSLAGTGVDLGVYYQDFSFIFWQFRFLRRVLKSGPQGDAPDAAWRRAPEPLAFFKPKEYISHFSRDVQRGRVFVVIFTHYLKSFGGNALWNL
jgi:hypothetical protein